MANSLSSAVRWGCGAILLGVLSVAGNAAEPAAPAASQPAGEVTATAEEIAALVEQLGDDRFQTREGAQKRLIEIGSEEVVRQAKAARGSPSLEVRQRAGNVLEGVAANTRLRASRLIRKNLLWTQRLTHELDWPAEVAGSLVCLRDTSGTVRGLEGVSGKERWQVAAASFAVDGQTLYVIRKDGHLEALDVPTCKGKRELGPADPSVGRILAVADGALYLAVGQRAPRGGRAKDPCRLLALDGRSGALKWAADMPGPVLNVAVAEGAVYAAGRSGRPGYVTAVDADTGKAKWTYDDASAGYMAPRALTAGQGKVYFRLHWQVVALDAATGKKAWSHQASGISIGVGSARDDDGPMAMVDGAPCISWGSRIVVLNPADGSEKWAYQPKLGEGGQDGQDGVVIHGGGALILGGGRAQMQIRVVAGGVGGGGVVVINGQTVTASQISAPAVAGKAMYFTSPEGLHAVSTTGRSELWRLPQKGLLPYRPVVADGVIYFAGRAAGGDGQAGSVLYAMKLPASPQ